jgi:hypothetical protein
MPVRDLSVIFRVLDYGSRLLNPILETLDDIGTRDVTIGVGADTGGAASSIQDTAQAVTDMGAVGEKAAAKMQQASEAATKEAKAEKEVASSTREVTGLYGKLVNVLETVKGKSDELKESLKKSWKEILAIQGSIMGFGTAAIASAAASEELTESLINIKGGEGAAAPLIEWAAAAKDVTYSSNGTRLAIASTLSMLHLSDKETMKMGEGIEKYFTSRTASLKLLGVSSSKELAGDIERAIQTGDTSRLSKLFDSGTFSASKLDREIFKLRTTSEKWAFATEEAVKAQATANLVQQALNRSTKDFKYEATTLDAKWERFWNTFNKFASKVGKILIPIVGQVVDIGTAFLNLATSIPGADIILAVVVALAALIGGLAAAGLALGSVAGAFLSLITLGSTIGPVLTGIGLAGKASAVGSAAAALATQAQAAATAEQTAMASGAMAAEAGLIAEDAALAASAGAAAVGEGALAAGEASVAAASVPATGGLMAMAAGVWTLMAPLLPIIAILAAVTAAIYLLYTKTNLFQTVWAAITGQPFTKAGEGVIDVIDLVVRLKSILGVLWDLFNKTSSSMLAKILGGKITLNELKMWVRDFLDTLIPGWLGDIFKQAGEYYQEVRRWLDWVMKWLGGALEKVTGVYDAVKKTLGLGGERPEAGTPEAKEYNSKAEQWIQDTSRDRGDAGERRVGPLAAHKATIPEDVYMISNAVNPQTGRPTYAWKSNILEADLDKYKEATLTISDVQQQRANELFKEYQNGANPQRQQEVKESLDESIENENPFVDKEMTNAIPNAPVNIRTKQPEEVKNSADVQGGLQVIGEYVWNAGANAIKGGKPQEESEGTQEPAGNFGPGSGWGLGSEQKPPEVQKAAGGAEVNTEGLIHAHEKEEILPAKITKGVGRVGNILERVIQFIDTGTSRLTQISGISRLKELSSTRIASTLPSDEPRTIAGGEPQITSQSGILSSLHTSLSQIKNFTENRATITPQAIVASQITTVPPAAITSRTAQAPGSEAPKASIPAPQVTVQINISPTIQVREVADLRGIDWSRVIDWSRASYQIEQVVKSMFRNLEG